MHSVSNLKLPEDMGGEEKAVYCRQRAVTLFGEADRAGSPEARASLVATAQKWTALAAYYDKQANRQ